jgi:hypothetical protein
MNRKVTFVVLVGSGSRPTAPQPTVGAGVAALTILRRPLLVSGCESAKRNC